ncbi:hypothetical protein TWF970_007467 [Orbilia oligospora]|uniref:Uncharacterized protein n=1 Tax=Orbilia oligospora TaxID=2813651 RepID=A0A7C8VBE1_ORBOL|nr:hypothetical protein TWF970_007467 [Orbilia oligospora]
MLNHLVRGGIRIVKGISKTFKAPTTKLDLTSASSPWPWENQLRIPQVVWKASIAWLSAHLLCISGKCIDISLGSGRKELGWLVRGQRRLDIMTAMNIYFEARYQCNGGYRSYHISWKPGGVDSSILRSLMRL